MYWFVCPRSFHPLVEFNNHTHLAIAKTSPRNHRMKEKYAVLNLDYYYLLLPMLNMDFRRCYACADGIHCDPNECAIGNDGVVGAGAVAAAADGGADAADDDVDADSDADSEDDSNNGR